MSVINEEELREIVEVVWMTVLDLPIGPCEEAELAMSDYLTAEITISGAWQGVVNVRASEQFLSLAASLMFDCPIDDVSDLDRSDSLTELTNMLGGTVKCLLPETSDLSLPTIQADDTEDCLEQEWVAFHCDGRPLGVAVTQSAEGVQNAA